jgi:hypothetical protein
MNPTTENTLYNIKDKIGFYVIFLKNSTPFEFIVVIKDKDILSTYTVKPVLRGHDLWDKEKVT